MRKILSGFIFVTLLFFSLFSLTPNVLADENPEAGNVRVTTVLPDENTVTNYIPADGSYSPTNEATGYEFVYHVINGKVYTLVPDGGFKFHTGMEIISVFTKEDTVAALFLDTNGEFLGVDYVQGDAPVGPDVTNLTKPGNKAVPWGQLELITEHTIFFVNYEKTGTDKVTINEVEYELNEVVTLTNDEPVLWLENGLPVWYGETYSFTALSDRTITTEAGEEPIIIVSAVKDLDLRDNGSLSHLGQVYVRDGEELIELGFLLHTDDTKVLTFDTDDVVVLRSNAFNEVRNEFLRTIDSTNSEYVNVRAYAVLADGTVVYESDIEITPNVPEVNNDYFRQVENKLGDVEANRAPIKLQSPSVDFVRVYIYEGNEEIPNTENALGYFDLKWFATESDEGDIKALYNNQTVFTFIGGTSNTWTGPSEMKNLMTTILGESYDKYAEYYFTQKLFVNIGVEYTDHSPLSGYNEKFYQEEKPIEQGTVLEINTQYAFPNGQGVVAFDFNRNVNGISFYNDGIEYLLVRVYDNKDANKETEYIGSFRLYKDGKIFKNDDTNLEEIASYHGGERGYMWPDEVKELLMKVVNYENTATYYLSAQMIVTDNSPFAGDSEISDLSNGFFRELEPTDKPDSTNMMAYPQENDFAIAFDRASLKINNENIKHVIVRVYTSADANKETDMVGEFIFYYDETNEKGKVKVNGDFYTLEGGVGNMWVVASTVKNILISALEDSYNNEQQYYFSNQIIISENSTYENDGEISELHPNFWREINN